MYGLAGIASAARVDLAVFENSSGVNVSGLNLWVDVLNVGGKANLVFHNDSTISSIITQIYLESGLSSLLANGAIASQSAGVSFQVGATPADPPGGTNIGWTGTFYSVGRTSAGGSSNGINEPPPIELLTLSFDFVGGATVDSIVAALGSAGTRIGEHIQSLPTGASVSAVTTVVPLPTAIGPGLSLLVGLALYRYRRSRKVV